MDLSHFSMLINKLSNKYTDIVPKESPIIILDSRSSVCMDNNGNDTKQTRNISRRVNFVRNYDKCKMKNIEWCEGGLKLEYTATTNVGDNELNTRMKYIMVRIDN